MFCDHFELYILSSFKKTLKSKLVDAITSNDVIKFKEQQKKHLGLST